MGPLQLELTLSRVAQSSRAAAGNIPHTEAAVVRRRRRTSLFDYRTSSSAIGAITRLLLGLYRNLGSRTRASDHFILSLLANVKEPQPQPPTPRPIHQLEQRLEVFAPNGIVCTSRGPAQEGKLAAAPRVSALHTKVTPSRKTENAKVRFRLANLLVCSRRNTNEPAHVSSIAKVLHLWSAIL